jgi:hypothetical protein
LKKIQYAQSSHYYEVSKMPLTPTLILSLLLIFFVFPSIAVLLFLSNKNNLSWSKRIVIVACTMTGSLLALVLGFFPIVGIVTFVGIAFQGVPAASFASKLLEPLIIGVIIGFFTAAKVGSDYLLLTMLFKHVPTYNTIRISKLLLAELLAIASCIGMIEIIDRL